jgi:serine/threonine-protein kinase
MTPQPLGSRYLLEEPLGQGGMGTVWRGRDRESGIPCAIKVLRPEFAADPAAVTRFVRERTALMRFRHPNVVTLRDMIVEGDCLALVMDLIEGGDLDSYRRSGGGTLPVGEALGLTAQICDALAAAHDAGIVHRDLKPANVLLDAGQVRLADFGIARIADQTRATTTGAIIGTIGFLAPEVIRGEEPTPACDVYAAGITLHELLTGTQPFTGQVATVLHGHLETVPGQPAGVPDRLWTLMSACLSKDPSVRPAAAVLARALRDPAVLRQPTQRAHAAPLREPTDPVPGWNAYSATAPSRQALAPADATFDGPLGPSGGGRTRALLAAAAALVLVLAGGTTTYLVTSGSGAGKSAGQSASPELRAAAQSRPPALTGTASSAPSRRPFQSHSPSAGPSGAPASPTGPAVSPSTSAATTPAATSSAPSGTPGTAAPTGPNLVADGDFTQSTLSAWSFKSGTFNAAVVSSGRSGGYAAQMTGQPNAGVAQIVTGLKPGTEYELTGWIYSGTGGDHTYIGAKAYTDNFATGVSRALSTANTWLEVSMVFTPAAGHTTADVWCWQAVTGTGYCTGVSLRALS